MQTPELTVLQIAIIGVIATFLVQVINVVATRSGKAPSRATISVVLMAVSIGLAAMFMWPEIVAYLVAVGPDPMALAQAVIVMASAVVGVAYIIYNLLGKQVFEKLGLTPDA